MVLWMVEMEVADPERPERSGRIAHGLPTPSSGPCPRPSRQEDIARVPTQPTPGRSLVTRRAVVDIVRTATLGSYGVTGFAATPVDRLLGLARARPPGDRRPPRRGARHRARPDRRLRRPGRRGRPPGRFGGPLRAPARRSTARSAGSTIHIDGLRFGPGGGPPSVVHGGSRGGRPARPRRQRDGRRLMARRSCDGEGLLGGVPGGGRQPRGARRRDQRAQRLPGPRRRHRLQHVRDGQGGPRRGRGRRRTGRPSGSPRPSASGR